MKIINVVGARPNFMKIAPLISKMKQDKFFQPLLLHTGQHYDKKMSDLFFEELEIQEPDICLGVGSASHAKQVAMIMDKFDDVCNVEKPDSILVVGDVNSTLACSLVASKLGIKIIHLEAGLRSYDRSMPEEINRVLTDSISDLLLTPSKDGNENLLKEGIPEEKIQLVGNIMIDTLFQFLPKIEKSTILDDKNIEKNNYILITLHRPSNVDNANSLKSILEVFLEIQKSVPVIFPMHPRTRNKISEFGLDSLLKSMKNIKFFEPLGYLDFQKLMINSMLVVTDSGGIQEETTALTIPCITMRENTERPITVTQGSNEIVGNDYEKLKYFMHEAINQNWKESKIPELWDGKTSNRVIDTLKILGTQ